MTQPPAHQPLEGITVVELGSSVAAPYTGWILAGLGARVVKIENPKSGDDARQWGRMFPDGRSSFFLALNGDKKSVTVDMRDPHELQWLREYCESEADVVIQNMRPGKVDEFGLDALSLVSASPRLIYCNLGAFGTCGPHKDKPGYDPLMQACGGIMSVTGEPERPPVRVGVSIVDMGTGMWCAIGILSALYYRQASGHGCVVDGSLYETSVAWVANQAAMVQVDGKNPEKVGSGARGMAPYQAYRCADGYLVISAPNDRLFGKLAAALGFPEWCEDPRFDSNQNRYRNLGDLNRLLVPILEAKPREHWIEVCETAGVPCAPVRTVTEMLEDEQTRALGIIQSLPGQVPSLMGMPLSFNGVRPALRNMPPDLGEHTDEFRGRDSNAN